MKIIELNKINDPRGNLTFLQNNELITPSEGAPPAPAINIFFIS